MLNLLQKILCWIGLGWALLGMIQMILNLFSSAESITIAFTVVGCMLIYVIPGGILFVACKPKPDSSAGFGQPSARPPLT